MELIASFVKDFFALLLLLLLVSYLAPKEAYRSYFRFFISALVVVMLAQPVFSLLGGSGQQEARQKLDAILEQLESCEYKEKGEDLYERFLEEAQKGEQD